MVDKKMTPFPGLGLAMAALMALPLQVSAQTPTEPAGSDKLTVVRDAETGQLRAPTAAELDAMQLRADRNLSLGTRAATQANLPKVHGSGARGVRVTDDLVGYSVVVRNADGSLSKRCFESKAAAEAALKRPDFAVRPSFSAKLETE